MTSFLTFCVSLSVTKELLDELNERCGIITNDESPPYFFSATSSRLEARISKAERRSRHPPEIFEPDSDEALQHFFNEVKGSGQHRWLSPLAFAVLDEQSSRDKTVVIYYRHQDLEDYFGDMAKGDYGSRVIGERWISWRVRFPDSFWLTAQFETNYPEIYDDVLSKADRFVDENGVFPVQDAARIITDERLREQRIAQEREDAEERASD